MNAYYVYILFDWLGIPRYIGKGKGRRDEDHERRTDPINQAKNDFIEQTWIMLGEIPKIRVRESLSSIEACVIEIALIKAIGRIDLGTGPLTNMTAGGDGVDSDTASRRRRKAWAKLTPEQRRKILEPANTAAKLAWSALSTAQKSKIKQNAAANMSLEQRREMTRHARETMLSKCTIKQRRARMQKAQLFRWVNLTSECRRKAAERGWQTRRARQ
jgi:hypothetical protein